MESIFSEVLDEEAYTRRVVKVTLRMSNRHGQLFLGPQIELEGWMTSLPPEVADD